MASISSFSSFHTASEDFSSSANQTHHTVPLNGRSPEVTQEALVNGMLGFGRQSRAAMLVTDDENYGRPAKPASIRSQPCYDCTSEPTFATAQEDDEPVGFTSNPDLFSAIVNADERRAMTLPLKSAPNAVETCSTPEAEAFYRFTSPYEKWAEERQERSPAESLPSTRPLTPFPRTTSRRYATLPIPSANEREYIDSVVRKSSNALALPRRRRVRRPVIPQQRLPVSYRATTPFSFDRPPTTTPFSSAGAQPMSPSHWLYDAPRVGGVQLEVSALQKATEGRGAVHRALWPEEREEMLGEVDGMAGKLIREVGRVREEQKEAGRADKNREGCGEEDGKKKKGKGMKFGWAKKIWVGMKKEKGNVRAETVAKVGMRAMRPVEDDILARTVDSSTVEQAPASARSFSNDTTVVGESTPTLVAETPSPPQVVRQTKTAKRNIPAPLQKHKNKRGYWSQFVSRGRFGTTPKSRELLRTQTSLVIPKSQRQRARPKVVVENMVGQVSPKTRAIEQRRIAFRDRSNCRDSEESVRVLRTRDV